MTDPSTQPVKTGLRPRLVVGLFVFAAVFLARAWLVLLAGSDVPFWDQWGGEGLALYKPWLDGTLGLGDLFRAHNEHLIVLSKLWNLGLLGINGQWDPLVQMVASASVSALTASIVAITLLRFTIRWERPILVAAILLLFTLPFGWQNTLWGFQSQVYLVVLFSLLALWLSASVCNRWQTWLCAGGCAVLAALSMGTAAAIGAGVAFLGVILLRDPTRMLRGVALITAGVTFATIVTFINPSVVFSAASDAQEQSGLLPLVATAVSWPIVWHPALCFGANAPIAILVALRLARRIESSALQDIAIVTWGWAAAVGAGIALVRGSAEMHSLVPPSRYTDFLCFLSLANLLALIALARAPGSVRRSLRLTGVTLWSLAVLASLLAITFASWRYIIQPRIENNFLRTQFVTLFERTGDGSLFERFPRAVRPSPGPAELERVIRSPSLAAIFSPGIHPGIAGSLSDPQDGAFRAAQFPTPEPPPGFYAMRTSLSDDGKNRTGEFRSPPFEITAPGVELTVTGQMPDGGASVALVPVGGGTAVELLGANKSVTGWMTLRKRVAAGSYSLVVQSVQEDGWLSFSAPRPVGPLSMVVREVRPFHSWFLAVAAGMGLIAILAAGRSRGQEQETVDRRE